MTEMGNRTLRRPTVLTGETYKLKSEVGSVYVTVNKDEGGAPVEVFLHVGKAGSTVNTLAEAIGRLISVSLQHGVPILTIIKQLSHIKSGDTYEQSDGEVTTSIPDAIAYALEKSLGLSRLNLNGMLDKAAQEEVKYEGELCGRCGGAVVKLGNCEMCLNCGESKCA